jgi:hypothetical protein
MKRLGDLISTDERALIGDSRHIKAAENLALKVLFPDVIHNVDYYVHRRPVVPPPKIPGLPADVSALGEYEVMLLGKLLEAHYPVLCVVGPMGSGKTTTLNYLLGILGRIDCAACENKANCINQRLLATIDFRQLGYGQFSQAQSDSQDADQLLQELIREICRELYARCREFVDDEEEFRIFWDDLISRYKSHADPEVGPVARRLLDEYPELYNQAGTSLLELPSRESLLDDLKSKDPLWYLKYIILLWRHLIRVLYEGRRECALVVLDNLDGLMPHLQRQVLDFVMRSAHQQGPTFIIAVRPETRMRQGLAEALVDVVNQEGPSPTDVVLDRLDRFKGNPDEFYDAKLGLTQEQFSLIRDFLCRMFSEYAPNGNTFLEFVNRAAGKNIRLALLLAQGLFFVSIADMSNPEVTQHFLVRSCVRQEQPQFKASIKSPIENLFHTSGVVDDARLLLKLRLLKYIDSKGEQCALSVLRSTFVLFGYEEEWIKLALNEMLRYECQLLRSDGYDVYRKDWGDEQETLYLSEIGKAYIRHLVYDTNYIQEVMLDCRVNESGWPCEVPYGYLSEKLKLLRLFLRDLHAVAGKRLNVLWGAYG